MAVGKLIEFGSKVETEVCYFQQRVSHHYDFAFAVCVVLMLAALVSQEFPRVKFGQTFVPSHVRIQIDDLDQYRVRRLIRVLIDDCT